MRGWTVAATVLSLALPGGAGAQRALSLEAGVLTEFEDATFLLGFRTASIKTGGAGVDFSIGTLPQAFSEAFIALTHLDITTGIALGSRSWLLPRAGLSAVVAAGEISGAAPGLNIGIGVLGRTSDRQGLRLDLTYTYFVGDEDGGITALTVGYAWLK